MLLTPFNFCPKVHHFILGTVWILFPSVLSNPIFFFLAVSSLLDFTSILSAQSFGGSPSWSVLQTPRFWFVLAPSEMPENFLCSLLVWAAQFLLWMATLTSTQHSCPLVPLCFLLIGTGTNMAEKAAHESWRWNLVPLSINKTEFREVVQSHCHCCFCHSLMLL